MGNTELRECKTCGKWKSLSGFSKFGDGKRRYRCKQCYQSRQRDLRLARGWEPSFEKHGLKAQHSATWRTWRAMKARCYVTSAAGYGYYGGRGIRACERWVGFEGFRNFVADLGDRPDGMSLDRIDVNGHYSCGRCAECVSNGWSNNVRWATSEEQANNTRSNIRITLNGRTQTLMQWLRELGLNLVTVRCRVERQGMSWVDALSKDTRKGHLLTINGETMNITDWARHFGITRNAIYRRFAHLITPKPCE